MRPTKQVSIMLLLLHKESSSILSDTHVGISATAAVIPCPVLLLTASKDPVAIDISQINNTAPYASNIRVKSLDAGHFVQLERPQKVNHELRVFVDEVLRNATLKRLE